MTINNEIIELVRLIHPDALVEVDKLRLANQNFGEIWKMLDVRVKQVGRLHSQLSHARDLVEKLEAEVCSLEADELVKALGVSK